MESRSVGGYAAEYIYEIRPERTQDGKLLLYEPQGRYKNRRGLALHRDGMGSFCKFRIPPDLPHEGVYVLIANGAVCYIGECIHLSQRFNMGYGQISPRNCFVGGQSTNCRINRHILQAAERGEKIELWFVKTETRATVESDLISRLGPAWNIHENKPEASREQS